MKKYPSLKVGEGGWEVINQGPVAYNITHGHRQWGGEVMGHEGINGGIKGT